MAHTTRVGDVEVLSLLDVGEWKLGNFFPTVPSDVWEEYRAIYPDALCDGNAICTSATAYAVRAGGSVILIDTGLGPGPHERIGGQTGQLLDELKSLGIRPDDVDIVIITHMHRDHVGWNALPAGNGEVTPTFPHAQYVVPKKDWEYYTEAERLERSPHLQGTVALYEKGLVDMADGEYAVNRYLTLLPTPGHTPGHQAVLITSNGERAAIVGDMVHTPAQVQETEWTAAADVDPELSIATRKRTLDRMEADHTLLCAGHFPHPGFGYLQRLNGRRIFQPLPIPTSHQ
jgi:glyoxylase-like metal-dependent hydrolase (beta-lactamase superfamily II)